MDVESHADSVDADVQMLMAQMQENGPKKRGRPKGPAAGAGEGGPTDMPAPAAKVRKQRLVAPKCRGCKQKIPPAECAPNFPGCHPCKRALDNINKLAHRQGKEAVAFVKKQREDDDGCFAMVQSYMELCPESMDGAKNKKRGTWSVARYQERTEAASGFIRDKVGEMMGRKLYIEFAQTTRGGKKSDDQAAAQWTEWEQKIGEKDPNVYHDFLGENGALRIWVHTADEMRMRSSYMQSKELIGEVETVKKPKAADIERIKGQLGTKHETMSEQSSICAAMLKNGEMAFQGNDNFLLDVTELLGKTGASEVETTTETSEPQTPNNSPDKTKPWVERDRVVSATLRSAKLQIEAFKVKAQQGLDNLKAKLEEHKANKEADFLTNFAGELKVLEVRVEALKLVLDLALV